MKKKILICGATGFVGRNIAEYYAERGDYEVHAVRFNRPEYHLPGAIWHKADLRDPQAVERLVQGMDVIVQAAATTSGAKDIVSRPYIHVTDNAVMNSYLFRSAFEAKVKHIVFFSCTVMYQSSEVALKETHAISALATPRSMSKKCANSFPRFPTPNSQPSAIPTFTARMTSSISSAAMYSVLPLLR